ncbi:DUF433 domain-containing protein [Larkinella ripae]
MDHYRKFIQINPRIRFGKPCIVGTRNAVQDLQSWLASGMSNKEILANFPELISDHIRAALAFAADSERRTRLLAA